MSSIALANSADSPPRFDFGKLQRIIRLRAGWCGKAWFGSTLEFRRSAGAKGPLLSLRPAGDPASTSLSTVGVPDCAGSCHESGLFQALMQVFCVRDPPKDAALHLHGINRGVVVPDVGGADAVLQEKAPISDVIRFPHYGVNTNIGSDSA